MTTFDVLLPYDPSGITTTLHDPVSNQIGDLTEVILVTITAKHPAYRKDLQPWIGTPGWLARCSDAVPASGRSKTALLRHEAFHGRHLARAAVDRLVEITDAPEVRQYLRVEHTVATCVADVRSSTGSGEVYSRDQFDQIVLVEYLRGRRTGAWVLDGVHPDVVETLGAILQKTGLPRTKVAG